MIAEKNLKQWKKKQWDAIIFFQLYIDRCTWHNHNLEAQTENNCALSYKNTFFYSHVITTSQHMIRLSEKNGTIYRKHTKWNLRTTDVLRFHKFLMENIVLQSCKVSSTNFMLWICSSSAGHKKVTANFLFYKMELFPASVTGTAN